MSVSPANLTVYGRLSFPRWTMKEALAANATAPFKRPEDQVTPEFNLVLGEEQHEKVVKHLLDVFIPFCEANAAKPNEKRNVLEPKHAEKLKKWLKAGDYEAQPPYMPLKVVHEKTQDLAPEGVAMLKIVGNRGVDIVHMAVVYEEADLLVPDENNKQFPRIVPIGLTTKEMYPGALVAATLNFYSYVSGTLPGISASSGTAVFKADAERFGGGVAIDEDAIFLD